MSVRRISVASTGLTIATTAYTSGDVVGGEFIFANAASARTVGDGSGTILAVSITDAGKVLAACDLVLFRAPSTPAVDNAANAWADADMLNYVGVVKFATADMNASANNNYGTIVPASGGIPYDCAVTSLYGVLITRSANAIFTAVGDVTISMLISTN